MRNKEKEKQFGYNNHPLTVINLTRTDVINVRDFHSIKFLAFCCLYLGTWKSFLHKGA